MYFEILNEISGLLCAMIRQELKNVWRTCKDKNILRGENYFVKCVNATFVSKKIVFHLLC